MVDRSVTVRLRGDISHFQRQWAAAGATTSVFVKNLESADSRMGNLVQTALAIAPALVPISAVGVPALVGLAGQATAAAAGVAVLVTAFNGIGDALEAVNKYQLEPTDENFAKMREEMGKLPAEGRHFVRFLDQEVMPSLDLLQDYAAKGLLPGFEDGIESLMQRLPELSGLVEDLAKRSGDLAADAGAAIASDELDDFFEFLRTEAGPTFTTLSQTVGNVLEGIANSLMGLNPLANDFEQGLLRWSEGFSNIDPSDFNEFVNYVRQSGPAALDALSAIGGGIVAIVKAAAPVGAVTLPVIEALANVIEVIAESPVGPVLIGTAAGLAAISRAIALFQAANGSALVTTLQGVGKASPVATSGLARMNSTISAMKTGAPILAGIALAYTDVDDKAGLSNTAMLATAGLIAGPWGAAAGGAIGLLLDWRAAGAQAEEQNRAFQASIEGMSVEELNAGLADVQSKLDALGQMGGLADDTLTPILEERKQAVEDQIKATEKLEAARESEQRTAAMAYAEQQGLNLKAAESTRMTTEQIKAQADAVRDVRTAGRQAAEAFLAYSDSIDDTKVSLSEWLSEQEESATALRNFNTNALRAAKNGLDDGLILSLQNAGEQGALRMKQLADATDEEIGRANKAWRRQQAEIERTEDIAQRLANLSPVKVDLNAETGRAMTNLKSLEAYLKSIKDEDVFVNIRHRQYGKSGGRGPVDGVAGGGTIPGQRHPYGDKMLYALAPGEEVISNRRGQADRHRPLLKAINGGLADGGTAGKRRGFESGGAPETDAERARRERREAEREARAEERERIADERQRAREAEEDRRAREEEAVISGQEKAAQGLIDAAEKQMSAAESIRDQWAQAMERTGQAATSGFRSSLFGGSQQHGLWTGGSGGGASDWRSILGNDISGLGERSSLIALLTGQGVTGSALEALLGQANNDQIQSLLDAGEADDFAALFSQREALLSTVSGQAGTAAYGAEYAMASAQVAALGNQILVLQQQLAAITGQRPVTVYEAISAQATAAEVARLQSMAGAA